MGLEAFIFLSSALMAGTQMHGQQMSEKASKGAREEATRKDEERELQRRRALASREASLSTQTKNQGTIQAKAADKAKEAQQTGQVLGDESLFKRTLG